MRARGIAFALILGIGWSLDSEATTYHVTINSTAWQGQEGALLLAFNTAASVINLNSITSEAPQLSDIYTVSNFTHNGVLGVTRTRGGKIEGSLLWRANPATNTFIDADLWTWDASQEIFYFADRAAYSEVIVCFAPPAVGPTSPHVGTSVEFDVVLANNPRMVGSHSGLVNDQFAVYWLDSRLTVPIATADPSGANALFTLEPPIYDGTGPLPTNWTVTTYSPATYTAGGGGSPATISVTLPTPPDLVAPAAITDLTIASYGRKSVALSWPAPGDDGVVGTAHLYDIRYSPSPINTQSDFDLATPLTVGVPPPGPSGTLQCVLFDNILCGPMYFAIETIDEVGNRSTVSNDPTVTIPCGGTVYAVECGGLLVFQTGQENEWMTRVRFGGGDQAAELNGVVPLGYDLGVDRDLIGTRLVVSGSIHAGIREVGIGTIELRHDEFAFAAGESVYAGRFSRAAAVSDAAGTPAVPAGDGPYGRSFDITTDGSITVSIDPGESIGALLVSASSVTGNGSVDRSELVVEAWTSGAWRVITALPVNATGRPLAIRVVAAPRYRIIARGGAKGEFLGSILIGRAILPEWLSPLEVEHSKLGAVAPEPDGRLDVPLSLVDGEAIALNAALRGSSTGMRRQLVLRVVGSVAPVAGVEDQEATKIAWVNGLGLIGPNPAASDVSIGFTVARASHVQMRIYDVAGRLVRTLVDEMHMPGEHRVVWSRVDDDGTHVRPGVYFCRLDIDGWRARHKLVVVRARS